MRFARVTFLRGRQPDNRNIFGDDKQPFVASPFALPVPLGSPSFTNLLSSVPGEKERLPSPLGVALCMPLVRQEEDECTGNTGYDLTNVPEQKHLLRSDNEGTTWCSPSRRNIKRAAAPSSTLAFFQISSFPIDRSADRFSPPFCPSAPPASPGQIHAVVHHRRERGRDTLDR